MAKSKIDDLVNLKKLVTALKNFKSDDHGLELSKKECHALAAYVLSLENKIIDLEKELAALKEGEPAVFPIRDKMGYYPVCPKCGADLYSKMNDRYCNCGAKLNWINS